jgi:hypothetical protein
LQGEVRACERHEQRMLEQVLIPAVIRFHLTSVVMKLAFAKML